MSEGVRQIELPQTLCESAEKLYGAQFGGLEGLLSYLLEEITRADIARLDEEEQRLVEERLRNLGYV
jgi:hypothetical protein